MTKRKQEQGLLPLQIIEIVMPAMRAIILGVSFGIFIHGYWLVDLFPVDSGRLFYATILSCLLGMAGYALFFRWFSKYLVDFYRKHLLILMGLSILTGAFLFFTTTDHWQMPVRYAPLFLPNHTLEVSVHPTQSPGDVRLLWFNTSLGDISLENLDYEGWKLENDRFVLTNVSNNRIRWVGKTGANARIVFQSSYNTGDVIVSWDGQEVMRPLLRGKTNFSRSFDIPFYASKGWILLLGVLNFTTLASPVCLVMWKKRLAILQPLGRALSETPVRFNVTEVGILLLVIVLATALRAPNLGSLLPTTDEYQQMNAAKQIVQGTSWASVYPRSLWLVTVPVSLVFRVVGYELWAARFVGVFFNVLALIPLYLIGRRITRPVAVLSVLLYATSPLIIILAREVREYAYYPFYFYWIVYGMILFLEGIWDCFRGDGSWRSLFTPSQILLGFALMIPPIYAFFFEEYSTFRVILIAYVALGVFVPLIMSLKNRNTLILTVAIASVALVGAYFWWGRSLVPLNFDPTPVNYFFFNPPQQWYYNRLVVIPAFVTLGGILASFLILRQNFIPLFVTALYTCFLGFFILSSAGLSQPRHLNAAHLWYVILVAIGLYVVWIFLQTFTYFGRGVNKYLVAVFLGVASINSQQILLPAISGDPGVPMLIAGHYHPDLEQLHDFLLDNVQKEDVLISTNVYSMYMDWVDASIFSAKYIVGVDTSLDDVLSIIVDHSSGWIVLDKIWINQFAFSPLETFSKNKDMEYVGLFGDEYVWRWEIK